MNQSKFTADEKFMLSLVIRITQNIPKAFNTYNTGFE